MNNEYKNNDVCCIYYKLCSLMLIFVIQCYYLMSFDQNMIIDVIIGSIVCFVNYSCNLNCCMIKWIVGGQLCMVFFVGDWFISIGDEFMYDYNFDFFFVKNVQICLCGEENCCGILGFKLKFKFKQVIDFKKVVKVIVKVGKRKFKEFMGNEDVGGVKKSLKK